MFIEWEWVLLARYVYTHEECVILTEDPQCDRTQMIKELYTNICISSDASAHLLSEIYSDVQACACPVCLEILRKWETLIEHYGCHFLNHSLMSDQAFLRRSHERANLVPPTFQHCSINENTRLILRDYQRLIFETALILCLNLVSYIIMFVLVKYLN